MKQPAVARPEKRVLNPRLITGVLIIVSFVFASILVPRFFTVNNFFNIIVQTCPIGLMAIGLTFVLVTGGIDLSMPAIMSVAAVIGAMFMKSSGSGLGGSILMIAAAMAVGLFNGFAVSTLRMIPFVVTLSIMVVGSGTAVWLTNAESVFGLPDAFINTLTGRIGPVPVAVIILAFFAWAAHFVMSRTIYGRRVYAVGINVKAARVSGIRTTRVLLSVYVISGFFTGIAAIISTARLGSASPAMGSDALVLDVISSAVIGGVSIYGGTGTVLGAVVGAIFITIISNIMNLLGVSYYTTLAIKGLIIVLATGLDRLRRRQD